MGLEGQGVAFWDKREVSRGKRGRRQAKTISYGRASVFTTASKTLQAKSVAFRLGTAWEKGDIQAGRPGKKWRIQR